MIERLRPRVLRLVLAELGMVLKNPRGREF
jgi:hypothetical protein